MNKSVLIVQRINAFGHFGVNRGERMEGRAVEVFVGSIVVPRAVLSTI